VTTKVFAEDDRFVSKSEVLKIMAWSPSTLYREEKAGRFPKAYKLSPNRKAHLLSEVHKAAEAKLSEDTSILSPREKKLRKEMAEGDARIAQHETAEVST